jgi:hypothetical protein
MANVDVRATNTAELVRSLSSKALRDRLGRCNVGVRFVCCVTFAEVVAGGDEAGVTMRVKRVLKQLK